MTALTLMGYPFKGRPAYLALAPADARRRCAVFSDHDAGGRVVIMHHPDTGEFLDLIARYRVTHTFLPPTVIYMLLDHPKLESADLSSLQCFWYGAGPDFGGAPDRGAGKIGPMAQLFGQTEAPMMISMMPPEDHYNPDGSIATGRLSSAGRVGPLVQVGIMDGDGNLMPAGERGEIVVRWIAGDGWVLQERRSNGGGFRARLASYG